MLAESAFFYVALTLLVMIANILMAFANRRNDRRPRT